MKIVKIINNNTVCAVDEKGKEQIVSGKGIGFGKKRGEAVDPAQIQKIYMITDSALRKRMVECLSEIPYEHIQLTSELVDYISNQISEILNESLMISLSDHISFAIERQIPSTTTFRRSLRWDGIVWRRYGGSWTLHFMRMRQALSPCTSSMHGSTPIWDRFRT